MVRCTFSTKRPQLKWFLYLCQCVALKRKLKQLESISCDSKTSVTTNKYQLLQKHKGAKLNKIYLNNSSMPTGKLRFVVYFLNCGRLPNAKLSFCLGSRHCKLHFDLFLNFCQNTQMTFQNGSCGPIAAVNPSFCDYPL